MANTNEYIVFEADQVLTNDHLNETFSYLDQQNRWTRNKLIGIGIVCGFNIVHHTGVIEITKGCGVTSQGYLILKDAARYAYMITYSPVDQPADLPFIYPGKLPFFKPFCENKTIYLLLTDDEYNALEDTKQKQAQTLSSQKAGFLNDYVVVLFLEATETDLKNCSAFDCTNKGEKMQFNVRPLLVAKKDLPDATVKVASGLEKERLRLAEFDVAKEQARLSHEISLKRFNVPYAPINTSEGVIRAFVKLVDDVTLQEVANAYIYCYEKHVALLNETSNPFINLFKDLKRLRELILVENPIFIQYFYDFIDDLIKAYYEFCVKISSMVSACCPDENLFPLHLVLGDASKDTTATVHDAWRTYFIYSPLFAKAGSEVSETKFLFTRMQIMIKTFTILVTQGNRTSAPIRITPSQYGFPWLSQRAIPYYYHITAGSSALYNYWNYYKTTHGNEVFNLSYNIRIYNHAKAAVEPLLYDIEHYNFFRIEGHIGENYQHVLSDILKQRLEFNLPFDVVAISADMLTSNAKLPQCNILDLETDYKLIISEFACKVHTPFCFLTKFPYPPTGTAFSGLQERGGLDKFSVYRVRAVQHFTGASYVNNTTYVKGDFMRKYCPPDDNTVGSYYLDSLKGERAFNAEISGFKKMTNEETAIFFVYNYVFDFINAVEELMLLLNTSTVATLDMDIFQRRYDVYNKSASQLTIILAELIASDRIKLSAFFKALELDILIDEFFILSTMCIDERLQTLIEEYRRRMYLYQSQNSFLNYYKKHPGLEHKAGVPKGGTFVVVYYSARDTFTDATGRIIDEVGAIMQKKEEPTVVYKYFDNSTEKLIRNFVEDCKDAPPEKKIKIIDILNRQQPGNTRFRFVEGEVIADFYVPYLCCSDCAPIAYVLPKDHVPPPPPETPTIKLPTPLCDSDKPADIAVTPAPGGKITDSNGNDVPGVDNTALTFDPAKAGANTYELIYTLNGTASDPFTVKVLATPKESSFTIKTLARNQDGSFSVLFEPAIPDDGFTYAWTFGIGFSITSSTDRSVTLKASLDASGAPVSTSASLQISNGKCDAPVDSEDLVITGNGVFNTSVFKQGNFNEFIDSAKAAFDTKPVAETQITGEQTGGDKKIAETGAVAEVKPPAGPTSATTGEQTGENQKIDEPAAVAEVKPLDNTPTVATTDKTGESSSDMETGKTDDTKKSAKKK